MMDMLGRLWLRDPWTRLGMAVLAALLASLCLRTALYALLRRLTRHRPVISDMLARARDPVDWLIPLALVFVAVRVLPETEVLPAWKLMEHGLEVALLIVVTWLALRCLSALERAAIRRYPVDMADNLASRRMLTQVRVLRRTADVVVVVLGISAMLLTIPGVRQLGTSLLASAGVAGLALGLAAKPVLSNLIAGVQIALTQPIRLDDVVIVQNEWGRIEEITGSYVVVRLWDERRLVVPLNWFMENPFQNWTRSSAQIVGSVFVWLDYRMPVPPLREELMRLCKTSPEWDGRVSVLQVVDTSERAMQVRALVSSSDSGRNWDLRCRIREGLLAYVQANYPQALPRWRAELEGAAPECSASAQATPTGDHSHASRDGI
ncbi:MAG TPA: mechanosensitive ion channel domain-containing protein [Dyella sp.]|uniref:mechanosensitive ion channel family protein n=1 Tax=Dyella sp. TaxID=1869338 RepID=UPI002D7801A3|nr:mechanosensitive ion channel domain-containing protein [Dyella sp.]HET6555606.1 mechanosensitive ion channel domain-containing protein [Dyella sp.]